MLPYHQWGCVALTWGQFRRKCPRCLSLICIWTKQPWQQAFVGPTWGPSGTDRTQVGPMLAPWTLLSGKFGTTAASFKSSTDLPKYILSKFDAIDIEASSYQVLENKYDRGYIKVIWYCSIPGNHINCSCEYLAYTPCIMWPHTCPFTCPFTHVPHMHSNKD